jgi:hypothetical protein
MLEEIAANDYGEEISDHLAGIEQQLSAAPQLGLLPWCPREVLELEGWSEPDTVCKDDPSARRRGHWKRLLACTLLLQSAATARVTDPSCEDVYFLETSARRLLQLTRSVISVGDEGSTHALGFMLWLYQEVTHPCLPPFIAFCALLLWLECGIESDCEAADEVWRWVMAEERQCRLTYASDVESERWLVGLSIYEDRIGSRKAWADTAAQVFQRKNKCRNVIDEVCSTLEAMLERIAAVNR